MKIGLKRSVRLKAGKADGGMAASTCKNEKGFALILSLMVMAGMAVLAIGIFTTSTTDMYIARNEKESKIAFYLAEAGIDEALGRLDLGGDNPRFVGENTAGKAERRLLDKAGVVTKADAAATANGLPEDGQTFSSTFMNYSLAADLPGTYSVTVTYADEAADTWSCQVAGICTIGDDNEIVMFGENFGFDADGVPSEGINPVFRIDSTGTTNSGTEVTVRVYVTSSALNVLPPGGTILWSEEAIDISGGNTITGKVASFEGPITGCNIADGCEDVTTTDAAAAVLAWEDGDMDDYLGLTIPSLRSYADIYEHHDESGTINKDPGDGLAGSAWGELCDPVDESNTPSLHVCDNEAKLIIIDNGDPGVGDIKINSGSKGRGILIITGNVELAGSFVWEGMIYVMGTLKVNGGVVVYGTVMIDGDDGIDDRDVDVGGSFDVWGSEEVAMSVGDTVGVPKLLRWVRI